MQISVVMTTYNPKGSPRGKYAQEALDSLIQHLDYDCLRLIVADDGSEDTEFISALLNKASIFWPGQEHISTNSQRKGVGASINRALDRVEGLWLYTTDDWILTQRLSLASPVSLVSEYDIVRLGPIHPNLQCYTRFNQSRGWWLEIIPGYGGYAFATRPFLATKGYYNRVGKFPEGLNAYETERIYAERTKALGARIAYTDVSMSGPWKHIGDFEVGTINP